jgi:hypothetical protein
VLAGAATLITLNRDMVVGAAAGLLVAFVVARQSTGWLKLATLAMIAIIALTFESSSGIGKRILSVGNQRLEGSTLADRHYEDGYAKQALEATRCSASAGARTTARS